MSCFTRNIHNRGILYYKMPKTLLACMYVCMYVHLCTSNCGLCPPLGAWIRWGLSRIPQIKAVFPSLHPQTLIANLFAVTLMCCMLVLVLAPDSDSHSHNDAVWVVAVNNGETSDLPHTYSEREREIGRVVERNCCIYVCMYVCMYVWSALFVCMYV
jgi:fluoride ion exporter CrcB/FEX